MTERSSSTHAQHDLELIAGLGAGGLDEADRTRAGRLVASCAACAELAADLRLIARAVAELRVPARTRDFRLRPEDAARLRPRGWRRLLGALGPSRLELARPLAPVFVTLGIVGLLVSASPMLQLGVGAGAGAASGPAASAAASEAAAAAPVAPSASARDSAGGSAQGALPATTQAQSAAPSAKSEVYSAAGSPTPLTDLTGDAGSISVARVPTSVPSPDVAIGPQLNAPVALLSAGALAFGVVLFALRRAARA
jgi:hypothetical protein